MNPSDRKALSAWLHELAEQVESCEILKVNLRQEIDWVEVKDDIFVRSGIESFHMDILRR